MNRMSRKLKDLWRWIMRGTVCRVYGHRWDHEETESYMWISACCRRCREAKWNRSLRAGFNYDVYNVSVDWWDPGHPQLRGTHVEFPTVDDERTRGHADLRYEELVREHRRVVRRNEELEENTRAHDNEELAQALEAADENINTLMTSLERTEGVAEDRLMRIVDLQKRLYEVDPLYREEVEGRRRGDGS